MGQKFTGMRKLLEDYDNILVVDDRGKTLFYDVADLSILIRLGHRPENFIGHQILEFYENLQEADSTIMSVLKTGRPMVDVKQRLITRTGSQYTSKSSTFPVMDDGNILGAIKFSSHTFDKEHIDHVDRYAGHPVYRKNGTRYTIEDVIAESPVMADLKSRLPRIAKNDTTLLLTGETGTGKNVIAQSIHNLSDRFTKPFLSLDCGELTGDSVERVLFGFEETAGSSQPGIFERAQGGTLFLDEVHVLPLAMQGRLMKVIGEKRVRRLGGRADIPVDLRVISAMNEDPAALMHNKQLREDFYYRLAVLRIDLPDLRARKEDIESFITSFIEFYNSRMGMRIEGVDALASDCLQSYPWPGNIRELRNVIESAFNHAEGPVITVRDLPPSITSDAEETDRAAVSGISGNLRDTIEEVERQLIEKEYQRAEGVLAETARNLGISKQSLKYKLDKYSIRS